MSAISGATSASPPSSTNAYDSITSEDFLRIMFSELTNQDPLAPNDTKAVLDQISSIRSIESDLNLSEKLESLVAQNELAGAGTLIGKFATGLNSSGQRVGDLVLSVTATREGAILNLANGARLEMSRVEEIIDTELLDELTSAAEAEAESTVDDEN
jgi:flagellar basal-body rod modification protein FlgD